MNANTQILQPSQEVAHNTHALRRYSRQIPGKKGKSRKSRAPKSTIITMPIRGKMKSPREQDAKDKARRKQWMDAEIEKLIAEHLEKSGGDLMKAAGFWFEREEQKKRQPWPSLEEGEAFIEDMKKDILDPVKLQQEMEEEEEAVKRKPLLSRRRIRVRGLGGSKTAPATPSVNSKRQAGAAEQARHIPGAQQLANSTTFNLTTPMKTVVKPKPPSAASSKQPAPPTALRSAGMLSTPLTSTSPPPPPLEKQVLSSNGGRGKRKQTETKKLSSDLGVEWAVNVTETGHRPCVKRRQQNGSE
ncbi:hypothetical protein EV127DRAFT_421049 [Xylaria flabelliformis]|nr:hypothetical protein EV127DRAFT_421049 [Xylaria flabelliformis]